MSTSPSARTTAAVGAVALIAALMSIAVTGFEFGIGNNVFHIPLVLHYVDLPQFAGDPFYRSLARFASLVWPPIRLISTEDNIRTVFLIAHILSRFGAMLGLLYFFRANGLRGSWPPFLAIATVAVTPWLIDLSLIGAHGLFLNQFTHSEVTWGPLFGALIAFQRGRIILAAVFGGLTLCINFFVGVWLLAALLPLLGLCWLPPGRLSAWARRACGGVEISGATLGKAAVALMVTSLPAAIWVVSALIATRDAAPFDMRAYVEAYFPAHFLIGAAKADEIVAFALLAFGGLLACWFTDNRRFWLSVMIAWLLLLLVGSAAPHFLNSRLLFNLHLIRSAGLPQFVGTALIILAGVRAAADPDGSRASRVLGVLIVAALIQPDKQMAQLLAIDIALVVLAANRAWRGRWTGRIHWDVPAAATVSALLLAHEIHVVGLSMTGAHRWMLAGIGAALVAMAPGRRGMQAVAGLPLMALALLAAATLTKWREISAARNAEANRPFIEVTAWVRAHGGKGPFLVPVDEQRRGRFDEFAMRAQRPVWVDWKQGAAVMWEPAFHDRWMGRYLAVSGLGDARQFLAYARANAVPYVVLPKAIGSCEGGRLLYRNGGFSVCASG